MKGCLPRIARFPSSKLSSEPPFSAYRVRRIDHFWGKELHYGEVQSARNFGIIRLVKKGTGTFVGAVHEEWKTNEVKLAFWKEISFIFLIPLFRNLWIT
jgi:hypothetical protein